VSLVAFALALPLAQHPPAQEPYDPPVAEASDEGRAALAALELAPGFEAELWAAEPHVANPVCLYVDASGEVYVAETFRHHAGVTDIREHMDWLEDDLAATSVADRAAYFAEHEGEDYAKYSLEHERIRLIRDTDGDGKADEAVVFADGFNDPMAGIGAGLLSVPHGENGRDVYYTCIPDLWLLRDTDGDGQADERERLHTGFGVHVALLGHDLHGLRIGPDGRLYFSSGDRGFRIQLSDGRVIDHAHTGAVLRCELDGSGLEVFATGLRNPQELVFDAYGNLWTGDNNSDGGDRARWVHVVEGSDSGWRYAYQWITWPNLRGPWNQEKLWHPWHEGQAAYLLPPVANLASGPSGLAYDPGTSLPPAYREHFFLCDFRGDPRTSGIHAFDVVPKGAGFELGEVEWLAQNTLATDVDFGPDGALYVSDWVEGWNKTGKGRIFRLFHEDFEGSPTVEETRALLEEELGARPARQLTELLSHPDLRVRQQAQFALVHKACSSARDGLSALGSFAEVLLDPEADPFARLHAIWGLAMVDRCIPGYWPRLDGLFEDPDAEVRAQLARVLGELPSGSRLGSLDDLVRFLEDRSPRVRMFAALGLSRRFGSGLASGRKVTGTVRAVSEGLWQLVRETPDDDPTLRHAAIQALAACVPKDELVHAATHAPGPAERDPAERTPRTAREQLAAVVALRRLRAPEVGTFLREENALVKLEAARAIWDEGLFDPIALAPLAYRIHDDELGYPLARRALNANFRLGQPQRLAEVATFALRADQDELARVEALRLVRHWDEPPGRDFVTGAWRPLDPRPELRPAMAEAARSLHERGILDAPKAVANEWIALASEVDAAGWSETLVDVALDVQRPRLVRARALSALADDVGPTVRERLREALFTDDTEVRAAALTAFRRIAPGEALPVMKTALASGSLPEQRAAYRALGSLGRESKAEVDALLADELTKLAADGVPDELALDLVLAAEERGSPALDALLELRAQHRTDPVLAPWLDSLEGGDAERGRELFVEDPELSCLRCHVIDDELGGDVGPDLQGVGARASRLALVEAIVDPNRRVTAGYESESFHLADGSVVVGRVTAESDDAIRVLDADGETHALDPADVEVRREALSSMPEGLGAFLTREELRDLVEFLARQR